MPKKLQIWKPNWGGGDPQEAKAWEPRTMWTDIIWRDLINLGLNKQCLLQRFSKIDKFGWSVEEVEIAAQDFTVWKILTTQAGSQCRNA